MIDSDKLHDLISHGWQLPPVDINPEPHRNIEMLILDAAGRVHFGRISSHLASAMSGVAMWREGDR